ncbi:hypothetical protein TRVL_07057 [Trypanosoma vivax]|uniref:Uncharacterized protein n=1 Tax=Trypanosoma vivax (strain Y486) TaxID=1055687 RepID=G0TRE8_TRYVY|nr:hypothetical protein TRVL_07057 [Trypanosoma vivax]CCC46512.1 conserved hypothetical protein, in T. vivax [Trypanosoma vivax Y486]
MFGFPLLPNLESRTSVFGSHEPTRVGGSEGMALPQTRQAESRSSDAFSHDEFTFFTPRGSSFVAPNATLHSCVAELQRYMNSSHIHAEEKETLLSIVHALACYAEARMRVRQQLDVGEACMNKLNQLNSKVEMLTGSLQTSSLSGLGDGQFSASQQSFTQSLNNSSSAQRGPAKVDMDLAECKSLLVQIEALAVSLNELHEERVRICASMEHEDERGPQALGSSNLSNLRSVLSACVQQLQSQWDTTVATSRADMIRRLSGGPVCGTNDKDGDRSPVLIESHVLAKLRQLCDDALGRLGSMRSRIARLGSSRVEEADNLDKLLATMDSYDPTAEVRGARRRQIDSELRSVQGWLEALDQLQQRAMALAESLQPRSHLTHESERKSTDSCPPSARYSMQTRLGATSGTVRLSNSTAAYVGERSQEIIKTGLSGAVEAATSNRSSQQGDVRGVGNSTVCDLAQRPSVFALEEVATMPGARVSHASENGNDGGAAVATEDGKDKNGEVAQPATGRPGGAVVGSGIIDDRSNRNDSTIKMSNANDEANSDGSLDEHRSSHYHPNAFDPDDLRQGRYTDRSEGFIGTLTSFMKEVVSRAAHFGDEDDNPSGCSGDERGKPRRRLW